MFCWNELKKVTGAIRYSLSPVYVYVKAAEAGGLVSFSSLILLLNLIYPSVFHNQGKGVIIRRDDTLNSHPVSAENFS